jgi:hypothetical protein
MLIRWTTFSRIGVFQFNPGPATRANFPSRCTMATCAVSTVKNEPKITTRTRKHTIPSNIRNALLVASTLISSLTRPASQ